MCDNLELNPPFASTSCARCCFTFGGFFVAVLAVGLQHRWVELRSDFEGSPAKCQNELVWLGHPANLMGPVPIELGSAKTFCRSTILSQGPRLPASSSIYMKSSITCCIAQYPTSVPYSLTVPCQDWYSLVYNLLAEQQTLLDSQRRSIWFSFVGATVAHRTSNPKVAGSSPARSIFASKDCLPVLSLSKRWAQCVGVQFCSIP